MKILFTLSLISILLFFGCEHQSNITSPLKLEDEGTALEVVPEIPDSIEAIPWPYPPGADSIFTTLGLPESEIPNLRVSEVIDGHVGGNIYFDYQYPIGHGDTISISAQLTFPIDAFDGVKEISMIFSHKILAISFYPHMVFSNTLDYRVKYSGIDVSGIDPNSIDFIFQNHDGTIDQIEFDQLKIDYNAGIINLKHAQLHHFSRYGFVN